MIIAGYGTGAVLMEEPRGEVYFLKVVSSRSSSHFDSSRPVGSGGVGSGMDSGF